MIDFICPVCKDAKLCVPDCRAGELEPCPICNHMVRVPDPAAQVRWQCPTCQRWLAAAESLKGQELECPQCHARQPIPSRSDRTPVAGPAPEDVAFMRNVCLILIGIVLLLGAFIASKAADRLDSWPGGYMAFTPAILLAILIAILRGQD